MTASGSAQQIRFCEAPDGVRIAYAVSGTGPPMLVSTCWLSHLQHDWESPVWRHFLEDIGRFATIVRYDERGYGLSDWDVTDYGPGGADRRPRGGRGRRRLRPVRADGDGPGRTAGHRLRAPAPGAGDPAAVLRQLRRSRGRAESAGRQLEAFAGLIKVGWGRPEHHFRRVFTSMMIPGASEEQMRWLDELQRVAASATTASRRPAPALAGQLSPGCCPTSTSRRWCSTRCATR